MIDIDKLRIFRRNLYELIENQDAGNWYALNETSRVGGLDITLNDLHSLCDAYLEKWGIG